MIPEVAYRIKQANCLTGGFVSHNLELEVVPMQQKSWFEISFESCAEALKRSEDLKRSLMPNYSDLGEVTRGISKHEALSIWIRNHLFSDDVHLVIGKDPEGLALILKKMKYNQGRMIFEILFPLLLERLELDKTTEEQKKAYRGVLKGLCMVFDVRVQAKLEKFEGEVVDIYFWPEFEVLVRRSWQE